MFELFPPYVVILYISQLYDWLYQLLYPLIYTQVQGTGKDGRILKEDLLNHVETQSSSSSDSSSDEEEGMAIPSSLSSGAVKVLATPAVRRVAREWGVSLNDIRGSGEDGRVLKEDILRHVEAVKGENHYIIMMSPTKVLFQYYKFYNSCFVQCMRALC